MQETADKAKGQSERVYGTPSTAEQRRIGASGDGRTNTLSRQIATEPNAQCSIATLSACTTIPHSLRLRASLSGGATQGADSSLSGSHRTHGTPRLGACTHLHAPRALHPQNQPFLWQLLQKETPPPLSVFAPAQWGARDLRFPGAATASALYVSQKASFCEVFSLTLLLPTR